ncbi:MAG: polyamine aminopropyltransferase, partial [Hyphomicrobiales bacterium]|nr:polyamine aminopropyltransferase [Hyphomicrobiales bacterium]
FRALFADAWAYLATTPTYVGGPMSFGWASDDPDLRQRDQATLSARFATAGLATRYYAPDVHMAAFALPGYVRALVEPSSG